MKRRLLDSLMQPAHVVTVEQRAPRLRHITLAGAALSDLRWLPGQHVRVQVSAGPGVVDWLVGTLRTYTVWNYDGENLELIVFDHGAGPGAEWARNAQPGDEVMFLGPQGSFTISPAAYHLFVGEETGQVAYGPMVRSLPAEAKVVARLEVESPDERLELSAEPNSDRDLQWTYRGSRSAAAATTLVEAVHELDLPDEPGIAYLAGEAKTIQLIRRHLVEDRNWPRRSVRTKPFWAPGRKGLD